MKKVFSIISASLLLLGLWSCEKQIEGPVAPEELHITVKPVVEALAGVPETKTYIDNNNTILWGTGEYMKIAVTAGDNTVFGTSKQESADLWDGEEAAMFDFNISLGEADTYTYMGLYPASSAVASNNSNASNYKVKLNDIQNAIASSYDPAAYIMVAKPESFDGVQSEWVASYRRATALNKVTLTNLNDAILSVEFVAIKAEGGQDIYLTGSRHINLETGESSDIYEGNDNVMVKYTTALPSDANKVVWFTTWGAAIPEGAQLKIVAKSATKSYTRTITARSGGINFKEGYLNTLSVNMNSAEVANITSLAGNYVILAKNGSNYYALKGEASGTRIASVNYTGSTTSYTGSSDLIWTIAASGTSYTIKNGDNYVGWTSGNSADLIAEADYDASKCLMSIDTNSDGSYKIYVTAATDRVLARNTSNEYFAFYTGSGYNDLILVPASALAQVATPTFSPEAGAVDSGTKVTISTATDGATIYYTIDGSAPTTSSTQGSSVTINTATTIKAIAVKEGMVSSDVATAQFTINGTINYPTLETSNVTMTPGTNGSEATVNGKDAIKVGSSSKGGDLSVTVPAGTTKLHLHAAAWNGVTGLSLNITGATVSPTSIALSADAGIANASPFTLSGNPEAFYFVVDLSNITTETKITLTSSIAKRFVVWGVNAEEYVDTREYAPIDWSSDTGSATISDNGTSYTLPSLSNTSALSVSYASSSESVATIAANGEVTAVSEGSTTISATYDGSAANAPYKTTTVSYILTVTDERTPNDGSLEHPYTASEARSLALGGDTGSYYISGIVTKIQNQYSASYGTANFWIDENGTATDVFEGYKIKYLGNVSWVESNAKIAVNDEVIIYGKLTKYNTTPETSSGYLVSLNGKTKGLTLSVPTVTTDTSNNAKEITVAWTAATGSNNAISYVVNCGDQSYSATAAGSHTFTMSDYGTYSVSITASASDAISAEVTASASLVDPNAGTPAVYTIQWGSSYNSNAVSGYTSTWSATKDGFKVNMANFNNNNNNWSYVKCGRNGNASVATIITDAAITEAIKSVTITIDAITAASINSITLYVSSSKDSGWTSVGTFTKATGNQSVNIASPAANKYYKIEFDCASGSANGLLTLSKAVFSTN